MARWFAGMPLVRVAAAMCALMIAGGGITGCGSGPFFLCEGKTSCPSSPGSPGSPPSSPGSPPGSSGAGDYAYVANSSAGATELSEYEIASGKLNSLGTVQLGFIPVALAVAPSNGFVYVASTAGFTTPGIYLLSIGSTGTLNVANAGNVLAVDQVGAMAISPDGNWLFTVNVDGLTMAEYLVNQSTGMLTLEGELTLPGTSCALSIALPVSQTCSVSVSPSEQYVTTSLGPSGDFIFPYSSATNVGASQVGALAVSSFSVTNPVGNFSTVMDRNDYMYVAQTNSIQTYLVQPAGLTPESVLNPAPGSLPRSLALGKGDNYVYAANEGPGTIAAYAVSGSAVLTQVTGAPFAGPTKVSSIAVDNTGGYLVAVGYDGSAGVRLYSIGSNGALTQVDQTGSGTSTLLPALVAMTH